MNVLTAVQREARNGGIWFAISIATVLLSMAAAAWVGVAIRHADEGARSYTACSGHHLYAISRDGAPADTGTTC